ncbi:hypothetical protein TOPH_09164 [Tolypocladium ophioglossoides CBS 100239]|uniref:Uncharacterized protein n=1 Tax=Tolypocladium ophioglossoides (strain CBS 100239) TaxID=1163406 RepID=A0A0L0MWQ8_TOLOC|nr:hypothetical protein TOPH_09164 [Tolypocladium ophioglossoides CBS 100239]
MVLWHLQSLQPTLGSTLLASKYSRTCAATLHVSHDCPDLTADAACFCELLARDDKPWRRLLASTPYKGGRHATVSATFE